MARYTHPFADIDTADELAAKFNQFGTDADVHTDGENATVTVHLTNDMQPSEAKQAADAAGYAFVGDGVMDDGNLELTFVDTDDVDWA